MDPDSCLVDAGRVLDLVVRMGPSKVQKLSASIVDVYVVGVVEGCYLDLTAF